MFIVLLWKAVCGLKSEITLSSSPIFFKRNFYCLSRKLPLSHKHCDKTAIYIGKTRILLDVNTFQR